MLTPELSATICEWLSTGNSMASLCAKPGMPDYSTIKRWQAADEQFRADSASARDSGTHWIADDTLRIADDVDIDPQHKRIMVDTRLRLIGKWNRKDYGDKVSQEISGPDGGPIESRLTGMTTAELDERMRQLARDLGITGE